MNCVVLCVLLIMGLFRLFGVVCCELHSRCLAILHFSYFYTLGVLIVAAACLDSFMDDRCWFVVYLLIWDLD